MPENVDAIRAMLELGKDGQRSIEKTGRVMGILQTWQIGPRGLSPCPPRRLLCQCGVSLVSNCRTTASDPTRAYSARLACHRLWEPASASEVLSSWSSCSVAT